MQVSLGALWWLWEVQGDLAEAITLVQAVQLPTASISSLWNRI